MRNDVEITLITETFQEDAYGIPQKIGETRTDVYAGIRSVSASEFFNAGREGLQPEWQFTMFLDDYDGQKIVEYNGRQYEVYRTYYGRSDRVELYVQERGATNG